MGSGTSKSGGKGKVMVAAEVVVPGQSKPVKVKGQVNLKNNEGVSGQLPGPATVKQVASNKFSLQMGSQSLGTFDVTQGDSDFASHLSNAAQMTVTNIEMIAEDDEANSNEHLGQSFQIQLSQDTSFSNNQYSDDEDWEEVIEDLDAKENQPTSSEGAKERKARLKQALQEKRTHLSQQEYEQMIANHKQEVELMAMLREKERERQKYTLASKVAQRQQRRKARLDEKKELEKLSKEKTIDEGKEEVEASHQVNATTFINGATDDVEKSAQQIEKEIQQRNAAFEQEMKVKRERLPEAEYQRLVAQHKAEMEKLKQKLERETDRQKQSLADKLEERRRRKNLGGGQYEEPEMSPEEIQQLEADLKRRQIQLEAMLQDKKSQLSPEEYKKLIAEHREELNKLQHRLDLQRERQRQSLLDKLAARKALRDRRGNAEVSEPLSADEVKDLQLALNQKAMDFKKQLKDAKGTLSPDETQRLIDEHRREMDALQEQLDAEKERMRRVLIDKLEARRRSGKGEPDEEASPLTAEEIKQLQLALDLNDTKFKEDMKAKKTKMSGEEYQRLMEQHKKEQEELAAMLAAERKRMEGKLQEKLGARRFRPLTAKEPNAAKSEEILKLEQEILQKESTFANEVTKKKSEMSEAEYQRLLAQHERDMERLKGRLAMAVERQKRNFSDKLSARQRRKAQWKAEEEERMRLMARLEDSDACNTEEDLSNLQQDISRYDNDIRSNIQDRKGKVSESEYKRMIEEHDKNMWILQSKLDKERERMRQVLEAKRMARGQKATGEAVVATQRAETQEELYNSDEEADEFGGNDTDAIAVPTEVTQLWTTPTQSTSLVVVPLKEEYPVKKKRELYTNPDIFRRLDAHAIKLAQTVSLVTQPTFSALVNELVSIGGTELEKVRLICRWITAQNCDEMDLNDIIDDTPLGVLKGLYHKKITFSTLFMRMCRFVGLRCVEINGCAKNKAYNPGQYITSNDPTYQHTWNAVRIDGYWHFVDCNWGVSHIQGSVAFDPFRFEYDEHYFLADPDVIIRSHFPNDPAWQLLNQPLSLQDFNASVPLKPDFFKFGFVLLSHTSAVIGCPNGELDIRVQCPLGLILSTRLATLQGRREFSRAGVPYDQFDFIHQVAENAMACYIRIPDPGDFYLTLYAKRQYLDGEINLETETEICRYLVHNSAPCGDQVPLPSSPADHWGPIGVMNVGLTPLTHRTAVVMTHDASDIEVRFRLMRNELSFTHTLTSWGWKPEDLVVYSMQRVVGEELVLLVTPPKVSRYGLHILAQYPGMPTPVHVCSYLLVCTTVKQVMAIPLLSRGEHWGPTEACTSLGMSAFTHPDPFVVTSDHSIQIVMGLSSSMIAAHELIYYGQRDPHNATSEVSPEFEGQSVTYVLPLRGPGYYRFTIKGKECDDPSLPLTQLFHYLIRKI
ncbi:uncharacterized protein LOC110979145 [Acanthaster planci]|uniref:Uncharacterized protein LOC110979145 n=1 Tax=Acanthaster planci TaxID=133434 RepID=A0A8B7YAZ7_ACAPL|nr:uncharacterized protein LOC110979145 [Acanthaster planci]XP_022090399.1 uncharacterized protein LOC110979145 [Acanthaster planci]